jgi:hypothetical protein
MPVTNSVSGFFDELSSPNSPGMMHRSLKERD